MTWDPVLVMKGIREGSGAARKKAFEIGCYFPWDGESGVKGKGCVNFAVRKFAV